jgi:multiple sugar transport system substrate-binding protein
MKESKLLAFVLLTLLVALTGCGSQEPPPEPVTLSFVVQEYEADYFMPLAEEFMQAHPEITIEISPIRGNFFQAFTEADVVGVNLFNFLQFHSRGAFLDLSPLIEQDNTFSFSDFYPGTVDLFSVDNKVWAIPSGVDTYVMYYNKTLFDQNGLSYPFNEWKWNDLLTAASAIRAGGDGSQYGYAVPDEYADLNAMILITQHGGHLFDDLNNPAAVTFNDPLNVQAMQWYQDLYYDYNVAPTPEQASASFGFGQEMIYRGVLQGDIGMWPGNFSDRGGVTWPVDWDHLNWGMVALPGDVNAATSGLGTGYAISSQTENPEAAWEWLVFISEQIPQTLIPARRSLAESKDFRDRVGIDATSAALQSMQNVTLISPDLLQFQGALENFSQAVADISDGTSSAQEALDWAQEQSQLP